MMQVSANGSFWNVVFLVIAGYAVAALAFVIHHWTIFALCISAAIGVAVEYAVQLRLRRRTK